MAASPTSITICNRLMRKIGKEMSGEVRKNHYASTTPFYFSVDCVEAKLFTGGQSGNRTCDTRIFSPLLYQLSYLAFGRVFI